MVKNPTNKIKGAIVNKTGLERLNKKHPWIFKGHLASSPLAEPGDLVSLHNNRGRIEGWGFWSAGSLCTRVLTFGSQKPDIQRLLAFVNGGSAKLRPFVWFIVNLMDYQD
jgi:23S rRNA (cytosine1962-C5)-methyltransferase